MKKTQRNRAQNLRSDPEKPPKLRISGLLIQARQRLLRFPVATLTGVCGSLALGSLISLLPENSLADWFLRFFAAFWAGIALFMVMSGLFALRDHPSPKLGSVLFDSIRYSLVGATVLGLPLFLAALLLRIHHLPFNEVAWVADWSPFAFLSLGGVAMAAVLPAMLAAWPLSVEQQWQLSKAIILVWREFEDKYYSPMRLCLFLAIGGFPVAWTPVIGLLVIPTLVHISAILHMHFISTTTKQTERQR